MQQSLKMLLALLVGTFAITSNVYASQAYYGLPKSVPTNQSKTAAAQYSAVSVRNYTRDTYMSYATFQNSRPINLMLGAYGSGMDIINYDINYPDTFVCLNVIRNYDGANVYSGCLPSGVVSIGLYASRADTSAANSKPEVHVTH